MRLMDWCPGWLYAWPVRDVDALAADLHARGLRVTPQRQLIYSLLAEKPSHPTIEAVHEAVLAVLPTVSLRTVYQALHDLEAMGEIRLVQVGNGPLRVDTRPDRHAHLRCAKCGELHDVDFDLSGLVLPVEQRRGFAVEGAEVIFSGCCPMCATRPQGEWRLDAGPTCAPLPRVQHQLDDTALDPEQPTQGQ
jgi:Fe2+ or Zn2+ uptake regulation protein